MEYWRLYNEINNTDCDYPRDMSVYDLFLEQVEKNPEQRAIVAQGGQLTYRELDVRARQVAGVLFQKGIRRNAIVGVLMDRSIEMMVAIYAVIYLGACYMPLSVEYPEKRIRVLIEDSGLEIILTQTAYVPLAGTAVEVLNLQDDASCLEDGCPVPHTRGSDSFLYVIYTSGSTGKPKGVAVRNYSVVNRLHWMQKRYPLSPRDLLIQKTPFVFDVSVWELFWWAIFGAAVYLLPPGYERFPQTIIDAVEKNNISVIHFVPSMFGSFLNYVKRAGAAGRLAGLKRVFCSGEKLLPGHIKLFNETLRRTNGTCLTNLYGPTEATVDVTCYDCDDMKDNSVPIGKPIDNTKIYIFNDMKLQPPGEKGELYLAGDGLAAGYLNDPEKTIASFVPNPYNKNEILYRTRDIVRLLEDGNIEYLGREDDQVKIRGIRIELGEIETVINAFAGVRQCKIIFHEDSKVNPLLIAFIVSDSGDFSLAELRAYLKQHLPAGYLPNRYVFPDSLPLTRNQKVDKEALLNLYFGAKG